MNEQILFLVLGIWWILGSILVGVDASDKKNGFFMGFITSLILSPIIGYLANINEKSKQTDEMEKMVIEYLKTKN